MKIKYGLLIVGGILLILSLFVPTHGINFSRVSDVPDITFEGFNSPFLLIAGICTIVLFGVGFFFNTLTVKILYYTLFLIFTAFICLMIKRMISPFMDSYTTIFFSGFYFTMLSYLLINTATIISLHRPIPQKTNSQLLDSEV